MKAKQYAEAIFLASRNKSDEEIERITINAVSLVKERRHTALLSQILEELEHLTHRAEQNQECVIRTAVAHDADRFVQSIEQDVTTLDAQTLPRAYSIDKTLVGGYEIRANGKRIDRTHKRALVHLYNSLLTNH